MISLARGVGAELRVRAPRTSRQSQVGDSISVNGVCLTATKLAGDEMTFDAVEETLARSNLRSLRPGDAVNLERSVSADRLFGGHLVLGHVDGLGTLRKLDKSPRAAGITIEAPEEVMRYVVPKGSIAVDGISLTVAECGDGWFAAALIPHTIENTNLKTRRPGDTVNLEADILGKYVEKFLSARSGRDGVTERLLAQAGWDVGVES